MTLAEFHNGLRILHSIDAHELGGPDWWPAFLDDPVRFFIRCDDETAAKIWAVVEKRNGRGRLGKRPVAFRVPNGNGRYIVTQDEQEAIDVAAGTDYQALYIRDGE